MGVPSSWRCYGAVAFISLAALFPKVLALAQEASSARTYPHWCEDLMGSAERCFSDPRARTPSTIVADLASEDPYDFLPEELAEFVIGCQRARERDEASRASGGGGDAWFAWCHSHPHLGGRLGSIMFIPRSSRRAARIASVGARVVPDCDDDQLQLDAGIRSRRALMRLLRQALSIDAIDEAREEARRIVLPGTLIVDACAVPSSRTRGRTLVQFYSLMRAEHRARGSTPAYIAEVEGGSLPEAYIGRSDCPDRAVTGVVVETAVTPPELLGMPVDHIESYADFEAAMNWRRRLDRECGPEGSMPAVDCVRLRSTSENLFLRHATGDPCGFVSHAVQYGGAAGGYLEGQSFRVLGMFSAMRAGEPPSTSAESAIVALIEGCRADHCSCSASGALEVLAFAAYPHHLTIGGDYVEVPGIYGLAPSLAALETEALSLERLIDRERRTGGFSVTDSAECSHRRRLVPSLFHRAGLECARTRGPATGESGGSSASSTPRRDMDAGVMGSDPAACRHCL